jgi:hypothetical protein
VSRAENKLNDLQAKTFVEMMRPVSATESAPETPWSSPTLIFLAILCALGVVWCLLSYGYLEDDAYIHLDYARSVALGDGFSFNGVRANGDTAPLWILLLNIPHALGLDWIASAKFLCGLGLATTILAIVHLLQELPTRVAGGTRMLVPAAIAVTALNPYFVLWSFSGMEAVTAFGVSLWIIRGTFVGPATWLRLLGAAVLIAVAPLLRPELLLLDAVAGPVVLWRAWQLPQRQSPFVRAGALIALAVLMALPLLVWAAYALHQFGMVVPNTNVAKRGGPFTQIAPRLAAVYLAGFPVTLALVPLVTRPSVLRRIPVAIWVLLLWPPACILFYLADHTLVQTRYCLLSMPCLTLAVLWLLQDSSRGRGFHWAVAGILAAAVVSTFLAVVPLVANKVGASRAFSALSAYLHDRVPRNEPIAIYAIGHVAFESGHPLVDIGGITQPAVVPYLNDPPGVVRWAKQQGAHYFVGGGGLPETGATPLFSTSVRYLGWTFDRSRQQATEPLVLYKLP